MPHTTEHDTADRDETPPTGLSSDAALPSCSWSVNRTTSDAEAAENRGVRPTPGTKLYAITDGFCGCSIVQVGTPTAAVSFPARLDT